MDSNGNCSSHVNGHFGCRRTTGLRGTGEAGLRTRRTWHSPTPQQPPPGRSRPGLNRCSAWKGKRGVRGLPTERPCPVPPLSKGSAPFSGDEFLSRAWHLKRHCLSKCFPRVRAFCQGPAGAVGKRGAVGRAGGQVTGTLIPPRPLAEPGAAERALLHSAPLLRMPLHGRPSRLPLPCLRAEELPRLLAGPALPLSRLWVPPRPRPPEPPPGQWIPHSELLPLCISSFPSAHKQASVFIKTNKQTTTAFK